MKLVKFSKFLILVVLCLGFGIKSSLVKGLDINYREDSAANSNFAQLHNVAILGKKDRGLKFDDVFGRISPRYTDWGGKWEATGVLQCWASRLQTWKRGTAFLVKNKRNELRIITVKHGTINGDSKEIFTNPNPDTNTNCFFLLSRDYGKARKSCPRDTPRVLRCAKERGLAHEISHDRNFSKPINSPSQYIYTDLAVLKFKDRGPNVSKVLKLKKLKDTDNFSVERVRRKRFLKIPGQGRYSGSILAPSENVKNKHSCSVYPRKKDQIVMNDNVMITDCHTIGGFSGSPLVFTNQETGEREVSCVISSEAYKLKKKGYAFDERKSVNLCQAITDKVLDLLER